MAGMRPGGLSGVSLGPKPHLDAGGHFLPPRLPGVPLVRDSVSFNFGPAPPSSRALLFSGSSETFCFGSIILTYPCAIRMADMSGPALQNEQAISIFTRS